MNSLQEHIADIVNIYMHDSNRYADALEAADAILSLPSGLVASRECNQSGCISGILPNGSDCPICGGTGTISRDLTLQEAVEWAKMIAEYHVTMDYCIPINPSGERVEVNHD